MGPFYKYPQTDHAIDPDNHYAERVKLPISPLYSTRTQLFGCPIMPVVSSLMYWPPLPSPARWPIISSPFLNFTRPWTDRPIINQPLLASSSADSLLDIPVSLTPSRSSTKQEPPRLTRMASLPLQRPVPLFLLSRLFSSMV